MKEYSLAFIAGNLLFPETMEVIKLFLEQPNWLAIREKILAENTLQYKTPNTTTRIFSEIKNRVSALTTEELLYLMESDKETQIGILWIAICLQYRVVYEFVSETIPAKIILMENDLTHADYQRFYDEKAEISPELTKFAESTQYKAKTIIFKFLSQIGIIDKNKIIPMILPSRLGNFIMNKDIKLLSLFPLTNNEIARWINE